MKIVNRQLGKAADASAARHTAIPELRRLLLFAALLAIGVYFAVSLVVDMVVSGISFETEARLFDYKFLKHSVPTSEDERLERVRKILETLTKDETVPPLPYKLTAITRKEPNAFAFPGGTIGVTTGLLDELEEDIEFAFVLGHEIGHFHNRDHLRGMGRAVGVGVVYAILFGGQMGSSSLGNTFQYVLSRGYSRQQEDKADRFGVNLVSRVYGKTDGIDKLFKILQGKKHLPEWAYMFATHPSSSDRIANLKRYADEIGVSRRER